MYMVNTVYMTCTTRGECAVVCRQEVIVLYCCYNINSNNNSDTTISNRNSNSHSNSNSNSNSNTILTRRVPGPTSHPE